MKIIIGNGFLYITEQYQQLRDLEFVSDRVSYIALRDCWCNIIVLNVHAPSEENKYHMKILLEDFNT
jgi:hypothetical protein